MAPCGALSVPVREPTDACYCFCVHFVGTGGPRRDHQTVIPVLRTIASVIGSNRLFVLHFENQSVSIPLKHADCEGVQTAAGVKQGDNGNCNGVNGTQCVAWLMRW